MKWSWIIMESYVLEISSVFTISYSLLKEISYDSIHFPGGLNTTEKLQIKDNIIQIGALLLSGVQCQVLEDKCLENRLPSYLPYLRLMDAEIVFGGKKISFNKVKTFTM